MTMPEMRTGCSVMVAEGTMKDFLVHTASGTPMECPPPITSDTEGLRIPATISAMASPASTSPPTVFRSSSSPCTLSFCSISTSIGRICSYLVVLLESESAMCPSICPMMGRQAAGLSVRHPHFFKAVQVGLTVLIVLRHKKTPPRDRLPVFGLFNAKKHPQSGDASFKP